MSSSKLGFVPAAAGNLIGQIEAAQKAKAAQKLRDRDRALHEYVERYNKRKRWFFFPVTPVTFDEVLGQYEMAPVGWYFSDDPISEIKGDIELTGSLWWERLDSLLTAARGVTPTCGKSGILSRPAAGASPESGGA